MKKLNVGLVDGAFGGSIFPHFHDCDTEVIKDIGQLMESFSEGGNKFDLLIFSGGEDVNPARYNSRNTASHFNPKRDALEFGCIKILQDIPRTKSPLLLGICRGHQVLNVAYGANLVQDIFTTFEIHHPGTHPVEDNSIKSPSKLGEMFSRGVNSMHHQCVSIESASSNFVPVLSYGHIIEASVSHRDKAITVQFHPEFMDDVKSDEFFTYIKNIAYGKETVPLFTESERSVIMDNMYRKLKRFWNEESRLKRVLPSSIENSFSGTVRRASRQVREFEEVLRTTSDRIDTNVDDEPGVDPPEEETITRVDAAQEIEGQRDERLELPENFWSTNTYLRYAGSYRSATSTNPDNESEVEP